MPSLGKTFDELNSITAVQLANGDMIPIRDISVSATNVNATKYMTIGELRQLIAEASSAASLGEVMRSGSETIPAGVLTFVPFSSEFSASWFFLVKYAENSTGEQVGVDISGATTFGFYILAPEAVTFNYLVMVAV